MTREIKTQTGSNLPMLVTSHPCVLLSPQHSPEEVANLLSTTWVRSQQNQRRTLERCGHKGHPGGVPGAGKLRERKERAGRCWEPSQPIFQFSCFLIRANGSATTVGAEATRPDCTQTHGWVGDGRTRPRAPGRRGRHSTSKPGPGEVRDTRRSRQISHAGSSRQR